MEINTFLYNLMIILSYIALFPFNMFIYGKKFGYTKLKSFLLTAVAIVVLAFLMFFLAWAENGFKSFGDQNVVRVYPFAILIFMLEAKIFNMDFRQLCDYHALWPQLNYFISHIGCIFAGCCHGFRYLPGTAGYKVAQALNFLNVLPDTDNMMPQQLYEAFSAGLIFFVLYFVAKKHNFNLGGRLLFIMLTVYGTQRFFWEFLRDNAKVIVFGPMQGVESGTFGISSLALYSVAMVIEGIIFLVAFHIIDKKKADGGTDNRLASRAAA